MARGIRIPAVSLAILGQLVAVFGLPVVIGREATSYVPVTACGCSAADRDAGRCCCHRPALPPCCAKKAAEQVKASCCVGHDDSTRTPVVQWVNPSVRQKCLGDTPATLAQPIAPNIAPDMPADPGDRPDPVGWIAINDLFSIPSFAAPDDPPPRAA